MARLIVLVVAVSVFLFAQKLYYKRRLSKGLGRKVEDRELTSVAAWMEATPPEKKDETRGKTTPPA